MILCDLVLIIQYVLLTFDDLMMSLDLLLMIPCVVFLSSFFFVLLLSHGYMLLWGRGDVQTRCFAWRAVA